MGRIVFIDGRFVAEIEAKVSVFDRSFLYGDGLFETLSVCRSVPFRWEAHMERLGQGAKFLGLSVPLSPSELRRQAEVLIARNRMPEALLRLTVSRGVGRRGYSPRGADCPCIVMTLHPAPARDSVPEVGWKLATASVRLPAGDALARFKTCSKLAQVMARAEAEAAGADEALLLSTEGFVVEAASANLFWVRSGVVETASHGGGDSGGSHSVCGAGVVSRPGCAVRGGASESRGNWWVRRPFSCHYPRTGSSLPAFWTAFR